MALYTADFETSHIEDYTRVWLWAICSVDNPESVIYGEDIHSFMKWCFANPNNRLYFHNLKYDGSYILDWLFRHNFTHNTERRNKEKTFHTMIGDMGQFYSIDFCTKERNSKAEVTDTYHKTTKGKKRKGTNNGTCNVTTIWDSLKLLPFSVEELAKAFNLPMSKGEIDYTLPRPKGYHATDEEKDYVKRDVQIVANALKITIEQGHDKMTAGACALKYFKSTIGGNEQFLKLFPTLNKTVDDYIRKAYRGGFTYVKEDIQGQVLNDGMVFDVNSMYPAVMYNKPLPIGKPKEFFGTPTPEIENNLYICRVHIDSFTVKPKHLPTIQIKRSMRFNDAEYIKTAKDVELYFTNVDLQLFKEQYNYTGLKIIDGYYFRSKVGIFKEHIDHFMQIKATTTGALRTLAKLMLNSLYGKFGTNPEKAQKIPYFEDDIVKYAITEKEVTEPIYTPVAVFVTSWARDNIIRAAQCEYDRFYYCDTDSLHIGGLETPERLDIHPSNLGAYKQESTFTKAIYLRAKTYLEVIDGQLQVKCCGMPKNLYKYVTFDNFREGASYDGKLVPRTIRGGCVLKEQTFTIKQN